MMKPTNLIRDTLPDNLATLFGIIGGVAQLCVYTNRLSQDDGFFISGLATIALGVICNKADIPRANPYKPPNYSPLDFAHYDEPPYNDPYYEPPSEISPKTARKLPGKDDDESSRGVPNITQYHSKYIGQSQKNPQSNQGQVDESGGFRGRRRTRRRLKPLNPRLNTESGSNSSFNSDSQFDSDSPADSQ